MLKKITFRGRDVHGFRLELTLISKIRVLIDSGRNREKGFRSNLAKKTSVTVSKKKDILKV